MKKQIQRLTRKLSKEDAKLIETFLLKTFRYGGNFRKGFTARDVVELATPKNSPLHRFFEWDDKRAAHMFRCRQAERAL